MGQKCTITNSQRQRNRGTSKTSKTSTLSMEDNRTNTPSSSTWRINQSTTKKIGLVQVTPPTIVRHLVDGQQQLIPLATTRNRTSSLVLASSKSIRVKSLNAILSRNNQDLETIRLETQAHLKQQYASEGIEFIYEVQELKDLPNGKTKHHALNYIVKEFILPDSPREICFTAEIRDPILLAYEESNDDLLYMLLCKLAEEDVFSDIVQNQSFQDCVTRMVEEGVVQLKMTVV
jgi:hypothetical protein